MVLEGSKPGTRTSGYQWLHLIKMSKLPDALKELTKIGVQNTRFVTHGTGKTPQMHAEEAQTKADLQVLERMRRDPQYRATIMADAVWGPHMSRNYWV